ncbi:MAG TPA: ribbon-helix-helix protein, CopG family [Thermoanaerobaculia bacterium]|jgi:hypothetical protein
MRTLTRWVDLPEDTVERIKLAARRRGVPVEELVRTSVEEKLARDADFEAAAGHVLSKNAELYERLS